MNPQVAQDLLTFLNSDNVSVPGSKAQWHFMVCRELNQIVMDAQKPKPAPQEGEGTKEE